MSDLLSRRSFVSSVAQSCLGVYLFPMLGRTLGAGPLPVPAGTAKHVIYLFMSGGMSHLDTFDPKPKKKKLMGPMETIPTKVDGILFGQHLPKTAAIADRLCVINSMVSRQGAHEQGTYLMHTSYSMRGTITHPSLGAWAMKIGGRLNKEIPGYVAIDSPPEWTSGGFFGAEYAAAPIGNAGEGLRNSHRPDHVGKETFDRRLVLADKLNQQFHQRFQNADVKAYEGLYQEAIRLMNSKDLAAFNLAGEPASARKLYGNSRFAQGCLLARRLVEHGVRFVEVQLGGWDTHYDNFTGVEARCQDFDNAFPALILDLEQRGLLKDTLVVVATEFGRSPEIKTEHKNGRDHHPAAFTCLLAGGGIKSGLAYGKSDANGREVRENPVSIVDFNATIMHALGIPAETLVKSPSGRPFRVADKGEPIMGLFA